MVSKMFKVQTLAQTNKTNLRNKTSFALKIKRPIMPSWNKQKRLNEILCLNFKPN